MNLVNQVALVTGASRGIGKAIALELARQGARVIGTATTEAGAEAISAYLAEIGAEAGKGLVLNVTDAERCSGLIDEISKTYGAVSILVNNAGITQDQLAMRMKDEEWDQVIATNLSAVGRLSRGVLRGMMKAKAGRIINITSVVIFSACSSGISISNSSSRAITSSTVSSESAPRSSTKEDSILMSASATPSCSATIFLTRCSISDMLWLQYVCYGKRAFYQVCAPKNDFRRLLLNQPKTLLKDGNR
jgi:NAD(P)-dependent dehydrogenase (short-subunit alcohol dehydrogenase family)